LKTAETAIITAKIAMIPAKTAGKLLDSVRIC
jgi:hypothetical protein